jgi:molybdate transport system permease protein
VSARHLFAERIGLAVFGSLLVAFLLVPMLALVATTPFVDLGDGLAHPLVLPAVRLSLFTTFVSVTLIVTLGTPLAWSLASTSGRVARIVEGLLELPIVLPPSVAGLALLLAFGRRGWVTSSLCPERCSLAFTTAAVVMAEIFVSAPFFVRSATSAFRRIDPKLVTVARSFGASPIRVFAHVAIPLAAPGLFAGAAMSWARALGEFGATLMFAGNLEGRTQTLPLAIYTALESDLRTAKALSVVLVAIAFVVLVVARAALRRHPLTKDDMR